MTDQLPATPTTGAPAGWYHDQASDRMRWWDGDTWTENFAPAPRTGPTNGVATASLILGICGLVLMVVPFFFGLFLGGSPDVLAVILGIVALNNAAGRANVGRAAAIVGIILGGVSLLSAFLGAGTICENRLARLLDKLQPLPS